jgi:hypothetical protein
MQDSNNPQPQDSQDQPADPAGANSSQASPSEKTPIVVSGRPKPARSWWFLVVAAAVLIIPVIGMVFLGLYNSRSDGPMTQAQRAAAEQVLDSVRVELESAGFEPSAATTSMPYTCRDYYGSLTGESVAETKFTVDRVSSGVVDSTLEVGDVIGRTLEKSGAKEIFVADPNDPGYSERSRRWSFDGGIFRMINQRQTVGTLATLSLIDDC